MKKTLLITVLILLISTYSFAEDLILSGEGAILIDMNTGEVLYEKNSNSQFYPASTTKILTAILAIEKGNLDDVVTIDEEIVKLTDGSHISLDIGEQLTVEQLLYATLIESANDAALALAKYISGSIDGFCTLMNEKAKEIGALNTNFINPNGLPNEEHLTTAYDLAIMGRYAMNNDVFRNIVSNYTYIIPKTNKKDQERHLNSANRLLFSKEKIDINGVSVPIKYEGVTGIKSGYTVAAQQCLVTSYEKDGHRLIAVVLKSNGKNIYSDIHKLFNFGIENFENINIGFANKFIDNFQVSNGEIPVVAGITESNSSFIVKKGLKDNIKENIIAEEILEAPIEKGQIIGSIQYILDDKIIAETNIISTMDIKVPPTPSFLKKILSKWYLFVFLALIVGRFMYLNKKRKLRNRRSTVSRI